MNPLTHILHLEDDALDAELIRATLESAGIVCQITRVQNRDEFTQALQQGEYDIILADYRLPVYDGVSALRLAQELRPEVPFIFVSGTLGEDAAVDGLIQGATDYVLKQRLSRLVPAVERALRETENRRERQRAEETVHLQSTALEAAANGIVITDRQGTILWVNPAFARLTGYTVEETIGQNPRILKSNSQDPVFYQNLWSTILSGQIWHSDEVINRRKDGTLYMEEMTITPVQQMSGEISHFIAIKQDVTDRKRAEEALQESESRYRLLAENASDIIFTMGLDLRFTYISPSVTRIRGYTIEEAMAQTIDQMLTPASLERTLQVFTEELAIEASASKQLWRTRTLELEEICKDGSTLWTETTLAPLRDSASQAVGAIGITRDITERKRTQEALRESETKFRAVFESSVDAIGVSKVGVHTFVNLAYLALFGYADSAELIGNPILDLIAPDRRAQIQANVGRRSKGESIPILYETRGLRKDGSEFDMDVHASTYELNGETYTLVILRDITERKRAEEEIRRLNRLYAVLSGINQAIVRTHERQQLFEEVCRVAVEAGQFRLAWIGRVDEHAETVQILARYGHSEGDLEHLHVSYAERASDSGDPTTTAIREGRIFLSNDLEYDGSPALWRDEAVRRGYHSLAVLPLMVSDRVWGVIHFYSDEAAFFDEQEVRLLEELTADLSYAVESLQLDERRRQAEEAMRQAQKLESLGLLAGGIAHDFNNLLVAMLGQTSLALEQLPAESPARGHIEKAVGAARRAADLTRQLLAYSGRGQFQVLPINLNTLIQENLHLFEVAIPKNVRLVSNLAESLSFIDGDVGQMQQVIMNLVINAAEAIGRNLGTVRVTTDTQ